MRKKKSKAPTSTEISESIPTGDDEPYFFGPPPIFLGEDKAQYEKIKGKIYEAVKPRDFIEEIWVNDVVDLTWEILRLRRLKAVLHNSATSQGVENLMRRLLGLLYTPDLAERWVVREPAALKEVETTLSRADLTMEAVAAETLVAKLDMFERIERMIATAEFRRNAILHQKDRRRLMLEESFLRSLEEFERGSIVGVSPRTRSRP
ncbi:MAG: hypothetical protein WAK03_06550 [Methylocystis sp.]|jgi:bacterioferritin (cytochrome b1)